MSGEQDGGQPAPSIGRSRRVGVAVLAVLAVLGAVAAVLALRGDDESADDRANGGVERSEPTTTSTTQATTTTTIGPDGPWQTATGAAARFVVSLPADWRSTAFDGAVTDAGSQMFPDDELHAEIVKMQLAAVSADQPQLVGLRFPWKDGAGNLGYVVVEGRQDPGTPDVDAVAAAARAAIAAESYLDTPREVIAEGEVHGDWGRLPYLESTLPRLPGYHAVSYFLVQGDWVYEITFASPDMTGQRANADKIAESFTPT